MTTKIVRRGRRVPTHYLADVLEKALVRNHATRDLITLDAGQSVSEARRWIFSGEQGSAHQGFPVIAEGGHFVGMVRRSEILAQTVDPDARIVDLIEVPPIFVLESYSLSEAADLMAEAGIGRIAVVDRADHKRLVGIISRSDILEARRAAREEAYKKDKTIQWRKRKPKE